MRIGWEIGVLLVGSLILKKLLIEGWPFESSEILDNSVIVLNLSS